MLGDVVDWDAGLLIFHILNNYVMGLRSSKKKSETCDVECGRAVGGRGCQQTGVGVGCGRGGEEEDVNKQVEGYRMWWGGGREKGAGWLTRGDGGWRRLAARQCGSAKRGGQDGSEKTQVTRQEGKMSCVLTRRKGDDGRGEMCTVVVCEGEGKEMIREGRCGGEGKEMMGEGR
ncbi:hypothetical protein Pcinc_013865 [Petrolisthes cinctipes]|uniref:Uncharacterized protein n=1 Tax=Petrolisthes cinctipes TaxID=88211 RepID=A0AAE1KTV5_PETCI|nr:hypothetical protein Pcinc_013865 [Petrolisthes cinctipes]